MGLFRRNKVWWMSFSYQGQQRRSTGSTDKRTAEAILAKVTVQIIEGRFFERREEQQRTFSELMERYLTERSPLKAPGSMKRDRSCLAHLLRGIWRDAAGRRDTQLLAGYKARRRLVAKPATINKELQLVRHAFNLAIREWEWCRENPMHRVAMEKVQNEVDRWLTPEEQSRLFSVSAPWLKDVITFALNTGMRQGEILSLRWVDVDFERGTLIVMKSKNGTRRTIPMNTVVFELLARKQAEGRESEWVFCTRAGTELQRRYLVRTFAIARARAGLLDFRFHDLRHTFATRLAQRGIALYKIQRLLGHKTGLMTQRYAHHSPESLRDGVKVLEETQPRVVITNLSQSVETQPGGSAEVLEKKW